MCWVLEQMCWLKLHIGHHIYPQSAEAQLSVNRCTSCTQQKMCGIDTTCSSAFDSVDQVLTDYRTFDPKPIKLVLVLSFSAKRHIHSIARNSHANRLTVKGRIYKLSHLSNTSIYLRKLTNNRIVNYIMF